MANSAYQDVSNKIKAHYRRYKKLPNTLRINLRDYHELRDSNPKAFTQDQRQDVFYASLLVIVSLDGETRVTRESHR